MAWEAVFLLDQIWTYSARLSICIVCAAQKVSYTPNHGVGSVLSDDSQVKFPPLKVLVSLPTQEVFTPTHMCCSGKGMFTKCLEMLIQCLIT